MNYNIIWRIIGYDINQSVKELNKIKLLPKDLFWKQQRIKRDGILQHHYQNTHWYKNFTGDINNLDWSDIPIITKRNLQDFTAYKKVRSQRDKHYYFSNTSGSSGNPLTFWKDKPCHSLAWAKIQIVYANLGISISDKEARFFGHEKNSVKNRLIETIKDLLLNRIRFNIFDVSDASLKDYLHRFKENKIRYIYGYTSVILEFCKFILKNKLLQVKQICPSLKLCIVTSEMCHDEDRKIIEKALGVPVFQEYGSSETSIIAIEDKLLNWGISTDRLWVEIIDEDNKPVMAGKSGRIIITDLFNCAYPFIRYEIGDIGKVEKVDNYPYLILKELKGRESDLIFLPSGKKAPGFTFYYISRSILEKSIYIKEFRIIQKTLTTFKFQIVSDQELCQADKIAIIEETSRYLEPGLIIEFEMCSKINNYYAGKIQHFFSELPKELR